MVWQIDPFNLIKMVQWLRLHDLQLQGFGFNSLKLAADFTITRNKYYRLVTGSQFIDLCS